MSSVFSVLKKNPTNLKNLNEILMKIEELFRDTFKSLRQGFGSDARKSVDFSLPSMPMVEACRTDDLSFFHPFIAAGHLTVDQMHHACQRYYLGKTRSGQPIFWMIDDMLTPLDAHIGTTWISTLLKAREPLIASWCITHCLFGLHLLAHTDLADLTDYSSTPASGDSQKSVQSVESVCHKNVCVVESEVSAVILSELLPEYLWMAYATTAHLTPDLFAPLQGQRVILFPRTDPTLSTYLFFEDLAALVRKHYALDITVDTTLEDHATPAQKDHCIDLLDFLFDISARACSLATERTQEQRLKT